jgi:hypothetical protein
VTTLPYEPDEPPVDPPAECMNRLMWQLARRVFADHQPGPDSWCLVCRPFQFYPCVGRQLANVGLRESCQHTGRAPWRLATNARSDWWSR